MYVSRFKAVGGRRNKIIKTGEFCTPKVIVKPNVDFGQRPTGWRMDHSKRLPMAERNLS